MTRQLWGFEPKLTGEAKKSFYIWSWRKLAVAGIMLTSLCFSIVLRIFGLETATTLGVTIYTIWLSGIFLFWYLYMLPSLEEVPIKDHGYEAAPVVVNQEWNSKVRRKGDLSDDRLPVTVVTGYLYVLTLKNKAPRVFNIIFIIILEDRAKPLLYKIYSQILWG